jgi:hypothetical protein
VRHNVRRQIDNLKRVSNIDSNYALSIDRVAIDYCIIMSLRKYVYTMFFEEDLIQGMERLLPSDGDDWRHYC